jgi:hypothetical protein
VFGIKEKKSINRKLSWNSVNAHGIALSFSVYVGGGGQGLNSLAFMNYNSIFEY